MDHYGPIARCVKDAALMLNVMKGHHPSDSNSFPDDGIDYVKILEEKPKKIKIGYTVNLGFYKAPEEEVEKCVLESARKLEQFDWIVEEVNLKLRSPELGYKTLVATGYSYDLEKEFRNRPEDLSPDLVPTVDFGLISNSTNIGKAIEQRKQLYEEFYQYFNNFDILITPTTPCPAFKLEQTKLGTRFPVVNKKALSIISWMAYTYPFNMVGLPAASIPCGWTNSGLPIGMQIVGRRFDEKTVFQVSKAFEEIAPWADKKPNFD
jgi:aspartyl-tRNA(Asn)/glutamyl-tRNA(Gln) amidotransferase subunit A